MSTEVRDMFTSISKKYDLLNDILSIGTHRIWKEMAVRKMKLDEGNIALDIATGTGDLARRISKIVGANGKVIGVDISPGMIETAKKRNQGIETIEFQVGDALSMEFPDNYFDSAIISFGIRNTIDPQETVNEMVRVIKSGSRVVILEFGLPRNGTLFSRLYKFYSDSIIPTIGKIIVRSKEPYLYLPRTISKFPYGFDFLRYIYSNKFLFNIGMKKLLGGIAFIYWAEKK